MVGKAFKSFSTKPGATISASFFIFIMIGTILLMLPVATVDEEGTSLVDALFTSTSALCVTGLTVQDTSLYFSRFGHVVIGDHQFYCQHCHNMVLVDLSLVLPD